MMMQNVENTDTSTTGIVSDLSSQFASAAMKELGQKAQLTNLTFPMATVGLRFYLPRGASLKDQIFGEMESTAIKVDTAIQSMANRMGDAEGLGASLRENFSKAVSSVQTIGLDFVDVQKAAEATLDAFGRNVSLSEQEYTNLLSTNQVTGVGIDKLLDGFTNAGMSIKDITTEMNTVLDVSNAIGVNAKLVSAKVVENLDKLNKFGFQNGVEGLAKMAAKAQVLRIEMKEIFTLADTLMDPEGAIELASALQRLGSTSAALTDPLRLMDMAQNDVGALTDELGKMFSQYAEFSEENQRFEILPGARLEIRELEKDLRLPAGTIEKMAIGTKDLEKKLSEISFSGFDIPQDTQELIANMSMMGESGEYMIKYVDEEGKSREATTAQFLDDFGSDVEGLKEALGKQKQIEGESADEKMYRRAGEQLTSLQAIQAQNNAAMSALGLAMGGGEFGKQVLETNERVAKDLNKSIQENLGPNSDIAKSFNDVAKTNREAMDIITGKKEGNVKDELAKVYESMTKVLDSTVTAVGSTITGIATDVGKSLGIEVPSFEGLAKSLGVTDESLNKFNESLKNGSETINGYITKGLGLIGSISQPAPTEKTVTGEIPTAIPTPLEQTIEITAPPEISTAENKINPKVNVTTEGTVVNPTVLPIETTAVTEVATEQKGTVLNPEMQTAAVYNEETKIVNNTLKNLEKDLGLKTGALENTSIITAMASEGIDLSQMMVGPAEASLEGTTYDFSKFQPVNKVLPNQEVKSSTGVITNNNIQSSESLITTLSDQNNFPELLRKPEENKLEKTFDVNQFTPFLQSTKDLKSEIIKQENKLSSDFESIKTEGTSDKAKYLSEKLATLYEDKRLFTPTPENKEGETAIKTKEIETLTNTNQTLQNFEKVITESSFGNEVPLSVSEFKGPEQIISQFAIPEAVPSYVTPPSETLEKKSEEYKDFISNQSNQNISLNENRNVKVDVNITGSKDPQTERQLRETIVNTIKNEMTYNNRFQRDMNIASSKETANFGLMTSEIQSV